MQPMKKLNSNIDTRDASFKQGYERMTTGSEALDATRARNLAEALLCDVRGSKADRVRLTALGTDGTTLCTLTPREWHLKASALAYALQKVARPGDRVVVPVMSALDFHVAFMGCLYAGLIAVPVPNPPAASGREQAKGRTTERLKAICRDCEPRAWILRNAEAEKHVPDLDGVQRILVSQPEAPADWSPPELALKPDTVALIQYTSGSTASPRGVVITHENWVLNRRDTRDRAGVGEATTIVLWLPLFHDMGLGNGLVLPLISGASLVIMEPATFVRNPLIWLRAIAACDDVFNSAPDFAFHLCVDRTSEEERRALDLSRWRTVVNGSEPVRPETIDRFTHAFAVSGFKRETMRPAYGLAECTLGVTMGDAQSPVVVRSYDRAALAEGRAEPCAETPESIQLVACGSPSAQVAVHVVEPDTGRNLPERCIGEVWVHSPCNALGYFGRSQETDQTFGATLREFPGKKFLRTGDLGFIDDNELFITGRIKDVLIVRGQNYYPQDAESVAKMAHAAFANQVCAAWPLQDDLGGAIAVVLETDERDERVLTQATRSAAVAVAQVVPSPVVAVAVPRWHVPRTTSGKIRRRECARQVAGGLIPVLQRWSTQ
jgi:nonribosomal peptide synthetase protein BlmVI